ncbi:MAG: histidine phosphatase family protein [Nitrospiria bacterium]
MTDLYLIRHGEVACGAGASFYGHTNIGLSKTGYEQAETVLLRFKEVKLDAVYSSDLKRTVEGGQRLADQFLLPLRTDLNLRERCWGRWEGLAAEEIASRFPEEWTAWCEAPLIYTPPDAEPVELFYRRVTRTIGHFVKIHPGQAIAVVCHGGVIRAVFAWISRKWPEGFFDLHPGYGSIHHITAEHGQLPLDVP